MTHKHTGNTQTIDWGNARVNVTEGRMHTISGAGGLSFDAWGVGKASLPFSLFHGMFTFDVPETMWIIYEDGIDTAPSVSTGATSSNGALVVNTAGLTTVEVLSRRHPRYQPNRGHLYSSSIILPNKTNDGVRDFGLFTETFDTGANGVFFRLKSDGNLYAVLRSGGVETHEELITIPADFEGFDVEKGNIYDIQFQWRGVGNYKFFIGNPDTGVSEVVHTISVLGTLDALSMENPALSIGFKATKTTQDVVIKCGCCDVTSENGNTEREQYYSTIGDASVGTDQPVVAIYSPATISSKTNTRDARLARVTVNSDKKVTAKVWKTRDATALTGAAFSAVNSGSYMQADVSATALTTAKATQIVQFNVEANTSEAVTNPSRETIDYYITHGDYIIVTATGAVATVSATVEWGEEI